VNDVSFSSATDGAAILVGDLGERRTVLRALAAAEKHLAMMASVRTTSSKAPSGSNSVMAWRRSHSKASLGSRRQSMLAMSCSEASLGSNPQDIYTLRLVRQEFVVEPDEAVQGGELMGPFESVRCPRLSVPVPSPRLVALRIILGQMALRLLGQSEVSGDSAGSESSTGSNSSMSSVVAAQLASRFRAS